MQICFVSPLTVTEFDERRVSDCDAPRLIAEQAPIGILSLAAVLEGRGASPHIIDLNGLRYDYIKCGADRRDGAKFSSYVINRLASLACGVYGFGTICSSYPLTIHLARDLKRARPDAKIILGGPQASVVDVQSLRAFPFIDFIVRGEAEATLPLLLDALSRNLTDLTHIGGLTHRQGEEVMRNPNAPVIENLDELPLPAFHLLPQLKAVNCFPLEAGRGCPFACSFCSTNDFFRRRFRLKSPHVLLRQMRQIKESYGIGFFGLIHDMFTVDRRKVASFCEAMIESGERFRWVCAARTDCTDDELISLMAKAGCRGVYFGIDSGSEAVQKGINKRLDVPEAASRIRMTNRHGIDTTVSLITGFPEESKDDLRATVNFLGASLRFRKAQPQLHLLAPLAETPITTQYRDDLIYDEIYSDISFCGSELSAEDREMIVAHRDIFPNFYAVPMRWLDRHYLKEVRAFLLQGTAKHRWLMVLLYQHEGDLLRVFDDWKRWHGERRELSTRETGTRGYYASESFSRDLLRFVRSRYGKAATRHAHLIETLAEVEDALLSFNGEQPRSLPSTPRKRTPKHKSLTAAAAPMVVAEAKVVHVNAHYKKLMRCLKRGAYLDRIPAEQTTLVLMKKGANIEIIQLNQLTYRLLRLCDGSRSTAEVVRSFSSTEEIKGVSPMKAGLFGLALLSSQGLIEEKPCVSHVL